MRESGSGTPLACRSGKVCWQEISDEARRSNIKGYFKREFPESKYKNLSFHVCFWDPGHQIAAYAQDIGADVIVMPSHGRTGI